MELSPPVEPEPPRSLVAAWYGLAVLILASIAGTVLGRTLIALVAESMKASLELSDGQIGLLNGLALTLVTAVATIPVGWLADKVDRRWLLAVCVLIWSAATAGFGLATGFPTLFLMAMGIAAGEAVLGPITYSVIPDLFPREKWVLANSVMVVAILLGSYAGLAAAGQLIGWATSAPLAFPAFMRGAEPWRTALLASAWTGPPLAVLVLLIRLRRRRPVVADGQAPVGVLAYFRENARALFAVFLGFGLSYAAFGAQGGWGPVVLQRLFHVAPADIGRTLGVFGGIASISGVAAGAVCARLARRRFGEHAPLIVAQGALFASFLVTLLLPWVQTATQYYAVSLTKVGLTFMATSLSPTVLQQLAPPHLRGRVIAIGGMITVLAQSIMPWLIGATSDAFFTGPRGILWAISVVVLPALLAGVVILGWGLRAVPETMRRAAQGG